MKLERTFDHKLPTAVLSADRLPGGPLLAACFDGVYRVDTQTGDGTKIGAHRSYASSVIALDATQAVSAGYDGRMIWWNLETNEMIREVQAHQFWSWDLAISPSREFLASVTGQYIAGSYRYDPAPSPEPTVKVFRVDNGEQVVAFDLLPSVQAVAFSPNSRFVAAGNLMGQVRVWEIASGELKADLKSEDFTSWGIIKSHCYIGGIYAIRFSPDGQKVLAAGMGPMTDPMAGNGKQRWQEFAWTESEPKMVRQCKDDQAGEGLMETLEFDASGSRFLMAGRLRGGNWNGALFDYATGDRIADMQSGYRVTDSKFDSELGEFWVVGTQGQPDRVRDDGTQPRFGRLERYRVTE